MTLKERLDLEVKSRNLKFEISQDKPDPLLVVREYQNEAIALISALFSYGKASLIVKFLRELNFKLLSATDLEIREHTKSLYYRFQKSRDIAEIFISIKRVLEIDSIENIVYSGYREDCNILRGLDRLIQTIESVNEFESKGYRFLIGKRIDWKKLNSQSPHKRFNMYFRWMVRSDEIDLGLWSKIDKKDLILPLDTHTFNISQKLNLLSRKSYDLKSAILITEKLREFDPLDPIKYDFAIYRIGQEKKLN